MPSPTGKIQPAVRLRSSYAAYNPIPIKSRMASERDGWPDSPLRHSSMSCCHSGSSRKLTTGVCPVIGRPRFFWYYVIPPMCQMSHRNGTLQRDSACEGKNPIFGDKAKAWEGMAKPLSHCPTAMGQFRGTPHSRLKDTDKRDRARGAKWSAVENHVHRAPQLGSRRSLNLRSS